MRNCSEVSTERASACMDEEEKREGTLGGIKKEFKCWIGID